MSSTSLSPLHGVQDGNQKGRLSRLILEGDSNMKNTMLIVIIISLGLVTFTASAQEEAHSKKHKHNDGFHRMTMIAGYAFIDNSFTEESDDILIVPAFGLNYDYLFRGLWGFGLHTDILLQQFKVEEKKSSEVLIRENPIAVCGMFLYKPHHRWTFFSGYGIEFEKHENFQLVRIGAEYGIELPKNWELGFSLEFDYKPEAYNSLLIGIGFSKLFRKVSK